MSENTIDDLKNEMHNTQSEMHTITALMSEEFTRLHAKIDEVDHEVTLTNKNVLETRKDLVTFTIRFEAFVQQIERENALTHAQVDVVMLNQEIEKKFGIYDKVRRVLLGILQSVDTGLVSKNAITNATENLMLGTPNYWLTPSLVALAAWIRNNKPLAEKALNEGLKRNLIKTELMFTLINNRLKRNNASFMWLSKYFETQTPFEMPQETLVLLGAYADGVFGPDSHGICRKQIEHWVQLLSQDSERVKSLEETWLNKIKLLEIDKDTTPFKYLSSNCVEWTRLRQLLEAAKKQKTLLQYLKSIIEAKDIQKSYVTELDDLLFKLVNEYDTDEFELKKKKTLAELIIKYEGDKEKAQQDFDTNVIILFKEKVSFFDILVNSVNKTEMSPILRRLSLLFMKEWILNAHHDFTAEYRLGYLSNITIQIGDWHASTKDGSNVNELIEKYKQYLQDNYNKIMGEIRGSIITRGIFLILCSIWMLFSSFSSPAVFISSMFGFALIKSIINFFKTRSQLKEEMRQKNEAAKQTCHAFCAEYVDWQKAYKEADKVTNDVQNYLKRFTTEEFSANSTGRKIINKI